MRALVRGVLGALVVLAALPSQSEASSEYGWPTWYGNQGWVSGSVGRSGGHDDEGPVARRGARAGGSAAAPRAQRRMPAVTYDDVGTGRGGQTGIASYYWQPQRVASGGWFNPNAMTAAHKTLPFGTKVRVTHRNTGRAVTVTINDRGPYIAGRIIDLSSAAAGVIGMKGSGVAPVTVTVLGR